MVIIDIENPALKILNEVHSLTSLGKRFQAEIMLGKNDLQTGVAMMFFVLNRGLSHKWFCKFITDPVANVWTAKKVTWQL